MTPELVTAIKQILNNDQKFKIANFIKPTFDDEDFLLDIMPILNVAQVSDALFALKDNIVIPEEVETKQKLHIYLEGQS